jgi:hypothetical protein
VSIVNTEEGVRLINKNSNSVDQQVIIGMSISQNNRLQLFSIKDNNGTKTIWSFFNLIMCWRTKWSYQFLELCRWNSYSCKIYSPGISIQSLIFMSQIY